MKRLLSLSVALCLLSTLSWAQTVVSTDAEIRAAVQVNNANIQLGADITITSNIDLPQGLEEITNDELRITTKIIKDGLLFIERNGRIYNAQGALVK